MGYDLDRDSEERRGLFDVAHWTARAFIHKGCEHRFRRVWTHLRFDDGSRYQSSRHAAVDVGLERGEGRERGEGGSLGLGGGTPKLVTSLGFGFAPLPLLLLPPPPRAGPFFFSFFFSGRRGI